MSAVTPIEVHDAVFVPAVMSAGLIFSVATIVRDLLHDRRRPGRGRRIRVAAMALARHTRTGEPSTVALERTLRPRSTYLLLAATALGAAAYIAVGATLNYTRGGGYVSDIAWLLSLSALTAALFGVAGAIGLALAVSWPHPPGWAASLLVVTPLGDATGDVARSQRRFLLGWGTIATTTCFGLLSLGIGTTRRSFLRTDRAIADAVADAGWVDDLAWLDVLGSTEVALALALVVGVATLRCLPFAVVYVGSVVATLGIDAVVKLTVDRPRPPGTALSALTDSYPSGHLAQIVLIAGFVPLAIEVLTDLRWHTHLVGTVLAATVVIAGLGRIERGAHWPSDVAGGVLLGAAVSLLGHWVLESSRWHGRCHDCPWVPHEHRAHGAVHLSDRAVVILRDVALAWSAVAIVAIGVLGGVRGIPRSPDSDLLGRQIEGPLVVAAMVVLVVAWAIAVHWNGAGAVGLVVGGSVLAVLSSLTHHPWISVAIAVAFVVPAVALWLAWQHDRPRSSLILLAGTTAFLLIGVYGASAATYGHFFGSQHPSSTTAALPLDRVEWVLAGAVTDDGFEVRARTTEAGVAVGLTVHDGVGRVVAMAEPRPAPTTRIVSLAVDGLAPATTYDYVLVVDGEPDATRGRGQARTFPDGPADLRFAFASCARTGSNGQVFDAIRAVDPDLYVVTGDLHYGNPDRADPELFRELLARALTAPAQAALYRHAAFAYVWDDHDYGPNDADGSSPTRATAQAFYREAIPSHVDTPTGPIDQAFTAGRVRVVITDTRSDRSPSSILGEAQTAWLLDELRRADEHALVLWITSVPWVAPDDPTRDDWGAHFDDRTRILDLLAEEEVDNLVMVSGDAHMVAIDDGTNTGGFPLLHAAALDRPGTEKGGPYSHGTFPGAGQFGLVEVDDDGGDRIEVTLSGRTYDGRVLVEHRFGVDVPDPAR